MGDSVSTDDIALRTVDLGKMYRIGGALESHATLRDAIVNAVKRPLLRIRHPGAATSSMETLWALRDVNIEVPHGQALGIIGRNGAGKSTLLKVLSRITEPTEGSIEVVGRVGSLLEVGTGFHPELTGRENIYLNGAILGMSRADIIAKFDEIVEFSEIGRFLDTPVKRYSSGMYVRLAFSVAAHLDPEILVIDEVLAVGDVAFQRKCLGRMEDVATTGRTVLFVSHNMQAIRSLCSRAVWLEGGRVVLDDEAGRVVDAYLARQSAEGAHVEWPTGEGPGDATARLVSMSVLDEDGNVAELVNSSRPARVRMVVDLGETPESLCLGFDLMTSDGTTLLRTYQTDGPVDAWPPVHVGRNTLECELPAGLLNEGRYFVVPRFSLHFIRWIIHGDQSISFEVHLDHAVSPYMQQVRPGLVAPVIEWRAIGDGG
jgi:lipopolysaccharide transport system ATP-binding protein